MMNNGAVLFLGILLTLASSFWGLLLAPQLQMGGGANVRMFNTDMAVMEMRWGLVPDMGGYAPTIGIIGTVMGLVHVLENLAQPEELGELIAAAFGI